MSCFLLLTICSTSNLLYIDIRRCKLVKQMYGHARLSEASSVAHNLTHMSATYLPATPDHYYISPGKLSVASTILIHQVSKQMRVSVSQTVYIMLLG